MYKILVLGAGMVGRIIAIDLSTKYNVSSADISEKNLSALPSNIGKITADLSDGNTVRRLCQDYDLIVGAMPGFLGFETVKSVIETGKNIVDISFFPEDAFELDELARQNNCTAVVDCGVAPGMSNLILGYHNKRMNVAEFKCYVGGLPFKRQFPFEYKAPFSPADVIEEYTRAARYVENGKLITKAPLSDAELINFEGIGTLEAFNSDGLRSLVKTMNVPNMIEKTLRYPRHIEYIKVLKAAGFFETKPVEINGHKLSPLEFTSKILFDQWKLNDDDAEFTVMRIIVSGKEKDKAVTYTYDLFDTRDPESGFSSMARTTGFTATAAVNLVLNGDYTRKGISPPEFIGEDEKCFNFIMDYLNERNVNYNLSIDKVSD
jgi:saccharopine dehydrogenase-like NADP-dependent oxidoreductase